jgi:hypothetical protein
MRQNNRTRMKSSTTGLWSEAALRKQVITMQNEVTAAGAPPNVKDLCTQFILLSKMLDSLVAYNMKPPWRQEIVPVIKLLCKFKDSTEARPSLLVLLLSVKVCIMYDARLLFALLEGDRFTEEGA